MKVYTPFCIVVPPRPYRDSITRAVFINFFTVDCDEFFNKALHKYFRIRKECVLSSSAQLHISHTRFRYRYIFFNVPVNISEKYDVIKNKKIAK